MNFASAQTASAHPATLLRLLGALCLLMAASLLAVFSPAAQAQGRPEYRTLTPPQPTSTPGKIEVLEFFQYSCPHCHALQPLLTQWKQKLPKDAAFRSVPITFSDQTIPHSRMFYTLEALGRLDDLHMRAFNAFHLERKRLLSVDEQAQYFSQFGIDAKKYTDTYNSFGVNTKVRAAQQLSQNYKIDATPTMAVDGRFVATVGAGQGGQLSMLMTVDALIAEARKSRR
jgi:protein dithiol oxidoreductase (disulfide-forming)